MIKNSLGKNSRTLFSGITGLPSVSGVGGYARVKTANYGGGAGNGVAFTILNMTFKKGVYLLGGTFEDYGGAPNRIAIFFKIGGTGTFGFNKNNTFQSAESDVNTVIPIVITADDTLVEMFGVQYGGSAQGGPHQMWAIKLGELEEA